MTHSFDFVGISEKLFLMRHLISGNREYCKKERLYQGDVKHGYEEWPNYANKLRYIVSNDLIECAAKLRVIQDTSLGQVSAEFLSETDKDSRHGQRIGTVHQGTFDFTLRESCNKIIHATNFELAWANGRSAKPYYHYSYWNGHCHLRGTHSRQSWHVELNVYEWCKALDYFMECLAGEVDW